MKPIISPIWFYLINTFDAIETLAFIVFLGLGILIFCLICGEVVAASTDEEECAENFKKIRSRCWKPFLIALVLTALLPEDKTSYEMLAASVVTPDNIETVGNSTTNLVDYIIDAVNKINDEGDTSDKK